MMIGSYGSHQCCHRPLNNCISLSFCFCSIRRFQIPKVGPRKFNVVRYNQTAPRHFRPQDKAKVVSRHRSFCGSCDIFCRSGTMFLLSYVTSAEVAHGDQLVQINLVAKLHTTVHTERTQRINTESHKR